MKDRINTIIADHLGYDKAITPDLSFADDMAADSLDMVELTMAFEEEFGIELADEEVEPVVKVEDAYRVIESKIG